MEHISQPPSDATHLTHLEQQQLAIAIQVRITLPQYKLLASTLRATHFVTVLELLLPTKYRSKFRGWAAGEVRAWLVGDKVSTSHFPLTMSQLDRLEPTWPARFKIPTV